MPRMATLKYFVPQSWGTQYMPPCRSVSEPWSSESPSNCELLLRGSGVAERAMVATWTMGPGLEGHWGSGVAAQRRGWGGTSQTDMLPEGGKPGKGALRQLGLIPK